MSYRIIVTKSSSYPDGEDQVEIVHCASKTDLDSKYTALTKTIGRGIVSVRVDHSDDGN